MFVNLTQVWCLLFISTASTRCSSQNSQKPTTNGTTGRLRVTASECVFYPKLGAGVELL